jgi:hypothetical protein
MIDMDILSMKEETKIVLITNNNYSKKLTINLINKWTHDKSDAMLKIIDLEDSSISNFIDSNTIKKKIDSNKVFEIIELYNVYSYPAILVFKRDQLIESIFGSYDNILEIIDIYF